MTHARGEFAVTSIFGPAMAAVGAVALLLALAAPAAAEYSFAGKWGSWGTGNGQFKGPAGVAVSAGERPFVYVADTELHRVQRFDSNGSYLGQWGGLGTGDGKFSFPTGVAVDAAGFVYVADTDGRASMDSIHRIQKFWPDGRFVMKWGEWGDDPGQFYKPGGVDVDSQGRVYVADAGNHRIQKFTSEGTPLGLWGNYGGDHAQFKYPFDVATDSNGRVYVADSDNDRIQKFSPGGYPLLEWGGRGAGDGKLDRPVAIATDAAGFVYVSDRRNNRIQKFTADGAFVAKWGGAGAGDGEFGTEELAGVATDAQGYVYVADAGNDRIQKFYELPPPPPGGESPRTTPPDTTPPVLSALKVTSRRFRVGKGTTFAYTLSEDARVVFTIKRAVRGRKSGTRCRSATRRLRKRRSCSLYRTAGAFGQPGRAGRNKKAFSGKKGDFESTSRDVTGKGLRPGRYRAYAQAIDAAGNRSSTKWVAFQVARPNRSKAKGGRP